MQLGQVEKKNPRGQNGEEDSEPPTQVFVVAHHPHDANKSVHAPGSCVHTSSSEYDTGILELENEIALTAVAVKFATVICN